jgi:hypothetical protein
MNSNPIIDEIREIRHRLAARFDNDVNRIGAEIRRGQSASSRRVVRRPKRCPVASNTPSQSIHPTGTPDRDSV